MALEPMSNVDRYFSMPLYQTLGDGDERVFLLKSMRESQKKRDDNMNPEISRLKNLIQLPHLNKIRDF